MDIREMIKTCLAGIDAERQEQNRLASLPEYMVQYCPCGHSHPIPHGTDLEKRAIEAEKDGRVDAITLHWSFCPVCNKALEELL